MRKTATGIAGLIMIGALAVPLTSATGAPTSGGSATAASVPYCGITWGSLAKHVTSYTAAPVTGVRAGRHTCYDRLVLDVKGKVKGYRVDYVSSVSQDGSGTIVPLRGGAKLRVVVLAPAYNPSYKPTLNANLSELVNVSSFSTFRQVAGAGSFEGQTTIGLGVRARLPFRVFILDGPGSGSRLVIDVAHRW